VVAHHPQVSADGNILLPLELAESDLLDVMESSSTRSFGDSLLIRSWMSQIISALAFSHSRGVAHRDVKPENILLVSPQVAQVSDSKSSRSDTLERGSGSIVPSSRESNTLADGADWLPPAIGLDRWLQHSAKLCDFGSALIVPPSSTVAAAHGAVGSSLYAAPEVFQLHLTGSDPASAASLWPGFRESLRLAQTKAKAEGSSGPMRYCGFKADVWSFGITLYVSVVGRPPFRAACPLDAEFRAFVLATQPKDSRKLPVLAPEHIVWKTSTSAWDWPVVVGPALRGLLLRCLQTDPGRRCSTADACSDAWFSSLLHGSGQVHGLTSVLHSGVTAGSQHAPPGMFDSSTPLQPGAEGGGPPSSQLPSGGLRTTAVGRTWLETHGARDAAAHSLVLSEASTSSADLGSGRNSFVEEMLEGGENGGDRGGWKSSTQLDAYLAQAGISSALKSGAGGGLDTPWSAGFSSHGPDTIRAPSHSSTGAVHSRGVVSAGLPSSSAAMGAWGGGFASYGDSGDTDAAATAGGTAGTVGPFDPMQFIMSRPHSGASHGGGARDGSWLEEGGAGGAGYGFGTPSADLDDGGSVLSGLSDRHAPGAANARGRPATREAETASSRGRSGSQKRRRDDGEDGGGGVFGAAAAAASSIASRTPDEAAQLPHRESLRTHSGGSARSLASEDGSKRRLVRERGGGADSPLEDTAPLSPAPGQAAGTEYSTGSGSSTEARRAAVMSFLRGER